MLPKHLANVLLELIDLVHGCSEQEEITVLLEKLKRMVECDLAVQWLALLDSHGDVEHVAGYYSRPPHEMVKSV